MILIFRKKNIVIKMNYHINNINNKLKKKKKKIKKKKLTVKIK